MKKILVLATAFLASAALVACGGQGTSVTSSKPADTSSQPAAEEKIALTASASTVLVGETITVTSSVAGVTFESRDTSVATIDQNGVVTGIKAGSTTITARKSGYKAGTVNITVEKGAQKEAQAILEFEDAEHYDPDGFWGMEFWGQVYGPGETPVEEAETASGGKSVGWFNQGCKETIRFTSSKAGKIGMGFMFAYNAETSLDGLITIKVNNVALDLTGRTVAGPEDGDTNNYYDWNENLFNDVAVKEGENVIEVECVGQTGVNMDCVRLYGEGFTFSQIKFVPAPVETMGKIDYIVGGYEWGPAINGLILKLNDNVQASALSNDLFTAKTNGSERKITGVSLCDAEGNVINAASGKLVKLDLKVEYESTMVEYPGYGSFPSANDHGSSPFQYSGMNSWKNVSAEIKVAKGKSLTVGEKTYNDELSGLAKEVDGRTIPDVKDWGTEKTNTDGERTLRYKAYETDALKNDGVKNPLIIWLHGQGEGGSDVDIALLGNDVTNLGQEKVQSHFVKGDQKGAYVLAVQTPTMWMDDGSGQNHGGAAHSIYTSLLKDTIDKYVAANTDVDASRLIIGGCSNGGYMTMEMAINYPSYFAAYYPTCEAYQDAFVSDADIAKLKDLSIWFTHSANDTTVNHLNFTTATYKRLMEAGATDVHYSLFENVRGGEGRDDGQLNDYQGHYSWIYVLKDECLKDVADATNPVAPSSKDVLVGGQAVSLWGWAASK